MTVQFLPPYLDMLDGFGRLSITWFVGSPFIDSKQHQMTCKIFPKCIAIS